MEIVSLTHEAGDVASPQLCRRCGRVIVPAPRAPFTPGRAITFQLDVAASPPSIKQVTDSGERMANIPWCDESAEEWLKAFDLPDR